MLKIRTSLGLLATIILLVGILPVAAGAQQEAADGNFVFINYIGQEIFLDLDDVSYTVPGSDTVPGGGQLTLTLPAGEHKYAANVPGGPPGYAGEFTIVPGSVVGKAARIDQTGPVVDNEGVLLVAPEDYVLVFDFDPLAVPAAEVPVLDTWQPSSATPAMGSVVWINHLGDELTVDLSGTLYKVPPKSSDVPGRLQIDVTPGGYRYTASVPNGSLNSEITVVSGQVTALNLTADPPPPRKYKVGEEFELIQPVEMKLFEEDLTQQANTVAEPVTPDAAPQTLPATGGEIGPVTIDVPTVSDGLLIKNYAGDTLIFTINDQTYTILNNAQQTLNLPPGQYSYTASIPYVATTGMVNVEPGLGVELSIAINVAHNFLNVYQN
jgi:hypothetical protein